MAGPPLAGALGRGMGHGAWVQLGSRGRPCYCQFSIVAKPRLRTLYGKAKRGVFEFESTRAQLEYEKERQEAVIAALTSEKAGLQEMLDGVSDSSDFSDKSRHSP